MQNKENFLFGFLPVNEQSNLKLQEPQENDIDNLQKVIMQSFKYCQAKKSKNRYIRSKKIEEMKNYQKKLIAIVKKKSEDIVSTLTDFSNQIISTEESDENQVTKKEEETLSKLKQKIASLKSDPFTQKDKNTNRGQQMRQRIKRVTLECEQQLEKMQSEEKDKKTDEQIQKLINEMQRPFKKLCSYFSLITKEIKQLQQK